MADDRQGRVLATRSRRGEFVLGCLCACAAGCSAPRQQNPRDPSSSTSLLLQWYSMPNPIVSRMADQVVPAASIAKLLVAIAAARKIAGNPRLLKLAFAVEPDERTNERSVTPWRDGARAALLPTLRAMISESDNAAADALIDYLRIPYINNVGRLIGLRVTQLRGHFFLKETALAPRVFTTGRDVVRMLKAIVSGLHSNNDTEAYMFAEIVNAMLAQHDRRAIPSLAGLPIANKTGEISGQLNNAIIIAPFSGNPLLMTILVQRMPAYWDTEAYNTAIINIRSLTRDCIAMALGGTRGWQHAHSRD